MLLWLVDVALLAGFFLALRWMFEKARDYPGNFFGRIRVPGQPRSPHSPA